MINRMNWLWMTDAKSFIPKLIPRYAKAATVKKDGSGYWLNVHWNCGIIAALTSNEALQAEENYDVSQPYQKAKVQKR